MLTILCPASRLDYLTLLAMGPGRRVHGDTFFCFFFFLVGTRIFVFRNTQKAG